MLAQKLLPRPYVRAIRCYRPLKTYLLLLLALHGGATVLALAAPWPLAAALDQLMTGEARPSFGLLAPLVPSSTVAAVLALAGLTLAIRLVQELVKLAQTMTQHVLNYGVLLRLRRDLFVKLQSMTPIEHGRLPEGDAVYRLCYDASGPTLIVNTLIGALLASIALISLSLTMLNASVSLTLITLSVTPVLVAANFWYGRVLRQRQEAARELESRVVGGLQRTLGAIWTRRDADLDHRNRLQHMAP